jgi:mycothiol system anti-sigma-R factor
MSDPATPQFNCQDAVTRLSPYLDRELDDDEQAAVHRHLERCGHCAGLFRFEANMLTLIGQRLAHTRAPNALRRQISQLCRPDAAHE